MDKKFFRLTTPSADKGVEQQAHSFISAGNAKQYSCFGKQVVVWGFLFLFFPGNQTYIYTT